MPFINELVPIEDMAKFDFIGVKRRAFGDPNWAIKAGWKYGWTIDRETGAFLVHVKPLSSLGPSGLNEPDGRHVFCVSKGGKEVVFTVKVAEGSSTSGTDRPIKTVWDWVGDIINYGFSDEYLGALKDALSVYGVDGVRNHTADFIVEFNF